MKKWKYVAGVTVVSIGLIAACSDSAVEEVDREEDVEVEAAADEAETEEEESAEAAEEKTATMGDTLSFDGVEITMTNARVITDDYMDAENGQFLAVELDIHNATDDAVNMSTLMNMSLYDAEGYAQDQSIMVDGKGSLDGEVGPGRNIKGEIVFDASESETYDFIFEDPFTSGQAVWTMTADDISK